MEGASDSQIWNFAKKEEFAIVTFDADFAYIANLKGFPPKIIWLRTGNINTLAIANLLLINNVIIKKFINEEDFKEAACLELGLDCH